MIADGEGVSVIGTGPGEGHDERDDWIATYGQMMLLTAVLREEDGDWKVVHLHFSVGVPDEEAMQLTEVPAA